jgi:Ran GTPase-activating protein (RanGAP) involved in mRNA processing and transport
MMIDLNCQKCEASFEVDAADVMEGNERIKCPNCDAKAPQPLVDDHGNTLSELCKAIAALRARFEVSLALETDDLPPPYDAVEEEEDDDEKSDEEDLLDSPDEAADEEEDL